MVRLAESILHDRASAEEAVQEVMMELWRRRESLEIDSPAYLYRATRNRALNALRHDQVRVGSAHAVVTAGAADQTDRPVLEAEIDRAVLAAIADLAPRCREIFELSRQAGLTYAQIAVTLEISVKTVETQMGKALRTLRDRLSPWLEMHEDHSP